MTDIESEEIVLELTKQLNDGESKESLVEILVKGGVSRRGAIKVLDSLPTKKKMKYKISIFIFWVLLFMAFAFALLIAVTEADDSHAIRSIAVIGILSYITWTIGVKLKSSYGRMSGREQGI